MQGYWNDAERTAEAIDADGWMHTGDLAVMADDGYVNIVGRIKDMVIRGGENVYPREIEEFLYTHPDVEDVQVIGVPDERYGEELMAWVRLRPGADVDAEALREFCRGRIAHFKVPRYLKFVDEFPMTVTGKVQKFKMREQAIDELGLAGAAATKMCMTMEERLDDRPSRRGPTASSTLSRVAGDDPAAPGRRQEVRPAVVARVHRRVRRPGAPRGRPDSLPITDLTSVPGPLRWFVSPYGLHSPAALLHDRLVGAEAPEGFARADADRLFRHMLDCLGVPFLRRWLMWAAVAYGTRWSAKGVRRAAIVLWTVIAVAGMARARARRSDALVAAARPRRGAAVPRRPAVGPPVRRRADRRRQRPVAGPAGDHRGDRLRHLLAPREGRCGILPGRRLDRQPAPPDDF